MKKSCVFLAVLLLLVASIPVFAGGYTKASLEEYIDDTIQQIRNGNAGMHYMAREYLSEAERMGGFSQEKLNILRNYLRNVRPHAPIVDRFR